LLAQEAIQEQKNFLQNAPSTSNRISISFFTPGSDIPEPPFEGLGGVGTVNRKDGGGRGEQEREKGREEREEERGKIVGGDVAYMSLGLWGGGDRCRYSFLVHFLVLKCL
jgi:hypothetical protein